MNALLREYPEQERQQFEQDLSARLEVLFRRYPVLCGFTVQADGPLPTNVTCNSAQNVEQAQELYGEVAQMLLDLVEECPEGEGLLHGRTFARTIH